MSRRRLGAGLATLTAFALWTGGAAAQEADKVDEPAGKPVGSLAARYRLREQYTNRADKAPAGAIGQSQVAFREVRSSDDPREAEPFVVQVIYSERPAEVSPIDERLVTDSIRRYTSVVITPDRKVPLPAKDLTVWCRAAAGDEPPLVMVLTPGRTLREEEYRFVRRYGFATNLSFLLPPTPARIGESWKVATAGAAALVNEEVQGGTLTGKLAEIRAHAKDPALQVAVVSVAGRLVTEPVPGVLRDTAVNARPEFAFAPAKEDAGVIDAPGAIEKLRLAQVGTLRSPEGAGPRTIKRDLIFERKRSGGDAPIEIPTPAPTPTPENSWLTYTDPKGRFHLRHPQGFQPEPRPGQDNVVDLVRLRADMLSADLVRINYVEKPKGRPETAFDLQVQDWEKNGIDVQRGRSEKLPQADWPGMAVHHMEAALTGKDAVIGRSVRRFFDAYVLQFPRDVSLLVSATTFQDQPEEFREQVRSMLKTAKLGVPVGP